MRKAYSHQRFSSIKQRGEMAQRLKELNVSSSLAIPICIKKFYNFEICRSATHFLKNQITSALLPSVVISAMIIV